MVVVFLAPFFFFFSCHPCRGVLQNIICLRFCFDLLFCFCFFIEKNCFLGEIHDLSSFSVNCNSPSQRSGGSVFGASGNVWALARIVFFFNKVITGSKRHKMSIVSRRWNWYRPSTPDIGMTKLKCQLKTEKLHWIKKCLKSAIMDEAYLIASRRHLKTVARTHFFQNCGSFQFSIRNQLTSKQSQLILYWKLPHLARNEGRKTAFLKWTDFKALT